MKLDYEQRLRLEFDKRCLADLRLEMPRVTEKYYKAVHFLSSIEEVSPYFIHLQASRNSAEYLYKALGKMGYYWDKRVKAWRATDKELRTLQDLSDLASWASPKDKNT